MAIVNEKQTITTKDTGNTNDSLALEVCCFL
jgi:hypothetical protein